MSGVSRAKHPEGRPGKLVPDPFSCTRPFLDYVLSAAAEAGYRRVCLVIGPEQEAIRRYYGGEVAAGGSASPSPASRSRKGTADAVAAAESFAGGDPFVVINSDNYYPVEALRALREQPGCAVALFERDAMLAGSNVPAGADQAVRRGEDRRPRLPGADHRKARRRHAGRLAQAAVAEHELLAVRAVDLRGVPGDPAFAARRVGDSRRRAVRHRHARRDVFTP